MQQVLRQADRQAFLAANSLGAGQVVPGVDPAGSRDIRNLIVDLKNRGVTVLLSSHLLEHVEEVCDRIGILSKGALVREGPLEELIEIEDRTEVILQNASGKLLKEIEKLATKSKARVIERRTSKTTLERLFLDVTTENEPAKEPNERE